jgi:hypothetical protein
MQSKVYTGMTQIKMKSYLAMLSVEPSTDTETKL